MEWQGLLADGCLSWALEFGASNPHIYLIYIGL